MGLLLFLIKEIHSQSHQPLKTHKQWYTCEGIFQRFSSEVTVKVNQTDGVVNYAFVNNPSDAEQAVKQLHSLRIDGNIVKVRLHSSGGRYS